MMAAFSDDGAMEPEGSDGDEGCSDGDENLLITAADPTRLLAFRSGLSLGRCICLDEP